MNFNELWDIIIKKNKNLQTDDEVKMKINGFKKALKLAYDKGYDEGHQNGYQLSTEDSKTLTRENDKAFFSDLFKMADNERNNSRN